MKKVCKECKKFYDENECPDCKSNQVASVWRGRVVVINPEKSELATKMNLKKEGDYAVKVR